MLDGYRPPAATRCHRRSASRHPPRPASRHTAPRLPARTVRTARSLRIAAPAYRSGMCRTRRVLWRPTASCGAFRRPAPLPRHIRRIARIPPYTASCGVISSTCPRIHRVACRHLPIPRVYPYDTAASHASRRQTAVSVSRPISSYQFLTDTRTAAGTPACPARIGQRCRRTRGALPCP